VRSIWLAGDATVAVLESESVGWGASGRNGGMTTSGMALRLRVAIQRYGFETAQSL
jgi:glycine/D-amino acid oxidase-like deaminating enzyme